MPRAKTLLRCLIGGALENFLTLPVHLRLVHSSQATLTLVSDAGEGEPSGTVAILGTFKKQVESRSGVDGYISSGFTFMPSSGSVRPVLITLVCASGPLSAKCSVRGIHLPCKQRFQGSRWGGCGAQPRKDLFYFFHIFEFFCYIFKEQKGDVLTNV